MPLYTDIRNYERETDDQKAIKILERAGYAEVPKVQDVAKKLLDSDEYKNNPVARRMKRGERLKGISDEILAKSTYKMKLPWRKEERKEYNKLIDELGEIAPQAWGFTVNSALHFLEPEGAIIWGGGFVPSLFYAVSKISPDPKYPFPETALWIGGIGAGVLLLCSFCQKYLNDDIHQIHKTSRTERLTGTYSEPRNRRGALKEEIDYVEKALGRAR